MIGVFAGLLFGSAAADLKEIVSGLLHESHELSENVAIEFSIVYSSAPKPAPETELKIQAEQEAFLQQRPANWQADPSQQKMVELHLRWLRSIYTKLTQKSAKGCLYHWNDWWALKLAFEKSENSSAFRQWEMSKDGTHYWSMDEQTMNIRKNPVDASNTTLGQIYRRLGWAGHLPWNFSKALASATDVKLEGKRLEFSRGFQRFAVVFQDLEKIPWIAEYKSWWEAGDRASNKVPRGVVDETVSLSDYADVNGVAWPHFVEWTLQNEEIMMGEKITMQAVKLLDSPPAVPPFSQKFGFVRVIDDRFGKLLYYFVFDSLPEDKIVRQWVDDPAALAKYNRAMEEAEGERRLDERDLKKTP
jgi:hypothetical protein